MQFWVFWRNYRNSVSCVCHCTIAWFQNKITHTMKFFFKKVLACLLSFLALFGYFVPVFATVTVSDSASSTTAGAASNHIISFSGTVSVPANGKLKILWPNGFTAQSGMDYTDVKVVKGGVELADAASTLTQTLGITVSDSETVITLPYDVSIASNTATTITLGTGAGQTGQTADKQYVNPSSTGNYTVTVESYNASNTLDDSGTFSLTITSSVPDMSVYVQLLTISSACGFLLFQMKRREIF